MIRVIEQNAKCLIQKVTHKDHLIGYQVVPRDKVGDASAVQRVTTLSEARNLAGILTGIGIKQPKAMEGLPMLTLKGEMPQAAVSA